MEITSYGQKRDESSDRVQEMGFFQILNDLLLLPRNCAWTLGLQLCSVLPWELLSSNSDDDIQSRFVVMKYLSQNDFSKSLKEMDPKLAWTMCGVVG